MKKMYGKQAMSLPYTYFDSGLKQFVVTTPGRRSLQNISSHSHGNTGMGQTTADIKQSSSGFHLTKDINTATLGSYPTNYAANSFANFAMLNNISYFAANDGIHGV